MQNIRSLLVKATLTFPKRQILSSSKLKEFADDNFKLDENGRKILKMGRKHWQKEKLLVKSNLSFSHSVFKILVLQTRKSQDSLSPARWHDAHTYLSSLGMLGTTQLNFFADHIISNNGHMKHAHSWQRMT